MGWRCDRDPTVAVLVANVPVGFRGYALMNKPLSGQTEMQERVGIFNAGRHRVGKLIKEKESPFNMSIRGKQRPALRQLWPLEP